MSKTVNIAPHMKLAPALLVDLDGTVRESAGGHQFIKNAEDIKLIEGIEEKLWSYKNKGYCILGITNQGGVAHGFKTPEENENEIQRTTELFVKNPFDSIKYAMSMAKAKVFPYNKRSLLRKPDIGMLALHEVNMFTNFDTVIDWDKSLLVGDREEDRLCAQNANIAFVDVKDFTSLS